jgi:DNA-binding response OmpR family regulator
MPNNSSNARPTPSLASAVEGSVAPSTLLVVDDSEVVRKLEAGILRQAGYDVLEAENAAEALRLAMETKVIHLLITDFSMPEVDGLELTRRFRAVHPKTPVLMVSGSLALLRDETPDLHGLEILPKPFGFAELLKKVRSLLDATVPQPRGKPWCCD